MWKLLLCINSIRCMTRSRSLFLSFKFAIRNHRAFMWKTSSYLSPAYFLVFKPTLNTRLTFLLYISLTWRVTLFLESGIFFVLFTLTHYRILCMREQQINVILPLFPASNRILHFILWKALPLVAPLPGPYIKSLTNPQSGASGEQRFWGCRVWLVIFQDNC